MSIVLFCRQDRLGANITIYVGQIVYALQQHLYIDYNKEALNYKHSIFVKTLFEFIDIHNGSVNNDKAPRAWTDTGEWTITMSNVVNTIKSDIISFFREHIYPSIRINLYSLAAIKGYVVPFNPKKTILVHLRLDDVARVADYDGKVCATHYKNKIEEGLTCVCEHLQNKMYNRQAPLDNSKLELQISKLRNKYPDYDVRLVTSPGSSTSLPYECIRSEDESYDLFLLCMCDVIVLSRSTFAISALFFGEYTEAYVPLWGHLACTGLYTKYDKSSGLTYFS